MLNYVQKLYPWNRGFSSYLISAMEIKYVYASLIKFQPWQELKTFIQEVSAEFAFNFFSFLCIFSFLFQMLTPLGCYNELFNTKSCMGK